MLTKFNIWIYNLLYNFFYRCYDLFFNKEEINNIEKQKIQQYKKYGKLKITQITENKNPNKNKVGNQNVIFVYSGYQEFNIGLAKPNLLT